MLVQFEPEEPSDRFEQAPKGKYHGQSNQQNREWHEECDAGRTSEGNESLKERPFRRHWSRDVDTAVGATSCSRSRFDERNLMSERDDYCI